MTPGTKKINPVEKVSKKTLKNSGKEDLSKSTSKKSKSYSSNSLTTKSTRSSKPLKSWSKEKPSLVNGESSSRIKQKDSNANASNTATNRTRETRTDGSAGITKLGESTTADSNGKDALSSTTYNPWGDRTATKNRNENRVLLKKSPPPSSSSPLVIGSEEPHVLASRAVTSRNVPTRRMGPKFPGEETDGFTSISTLSVRRSAAASRGASEDSSAKSSETLKSRNPGALPSTTTPTKHKVKTGESYWALAQKYYGHGKYLKAIQKANGNILLRPGMTVKIPAHPAKGATTASLAVNANTTTIAIARSPLPKSSSAQQAQPDVLFSQISTNNNSQNTKSDTPSDGRYFYYTVRSGDSLSGIAKKYYGKSSAFGRIQDANKTLHYLPLRAGEKIRIPK